ncbi:hypothetical protein KSP39_PZI006385 [Platanthera zijinensis]|uniref:Uncharacterized protein n=1 Tax=Platanthera zijinensis TaxID=2320716 RepID=A0AAP0BQH9_9ASPA
MGLLDKLWDDTLAGPRPETGLGRLRKPAPLSIRSDSFKGEKKIESSLLGRDYSADLPENSPRVTRSIMIKRPAGCPSPAGGTPPFSPADSTPPISPFSREFSLIGSFCIRCITSFCSSFL